MGRTKDNKVVYFLCAIFYCMCLEEMRHDRIANRIALKVISFLSKLFHFKKKEIDLTNIDCDNCVFAENAFLGICLWYYSFIWGFGMITYFVYDNLYLLVMLSILSLALNMLIRKYVLESKLRTKYFKQFKMKDNRWLWKWKLITILFCVTGIIVFFSSIIIFFYWFI